MKPFSWLIGVSGSVLRRQWVGRHNWIRRRCRRPPGISKSAREPSRRGAVGCSRCKRPEVSLPRQEPRSGTTSRGVRLDEETGFEFLAASLRASSGDLETFVTVLAGKLEQALPGRVGVERRAVRFLSKKKRVERIEVELGERRYILLAHDADLETRRAKAVRGVVLNSEELPLDAWLQALCGDLASEAQDSEESRIALERLFKE